nr:MAG TPA: hypothetical protein [Microviridae sp.]
MVVQALGNYGNIIPIINIAIIIDIPIIGIIISQNIAKNLKVLNNLSFSFIQVLYTERRKMKRFINNPKKANRKFSALAFKINPRNLKGGMQRGGIRLT